VSEDVSTYNQKSAITGLAESINSALERDDQDILWLVSGGSAIEIAVEARKLLDVTKTDKRLHVGLIDERYGSKDHKDSNYLALIQAGFNTSGIIMHPVLKNKSLETTTSDYNQIITKLVNDCNTVIALYGMGGDGHTAGLLPNNPIMNSEQIVDSYKGKDFYRITTTPRLIKLLDEVVLYVVGKSKWPIISMFIRNQADNLPVEILYNAKKLSVYTDY